MLREVMSGLMFNHEGTQLDSGECEDISPRSKEPLRFSTESIPPSISSESYFLFVQMNPIFDYSAFRDVFDVGDVEPRRGTIRSVLQLHSVFST